MADISSYVNSAANYFGLPPSLFSAQLDQESSLGTNLGTIGNIGQVTPGALTDVNNAFGTNYTESDLAGSPQIGVDVAAAYDSLLYNKSGSYETMLQNYGTIPSDLSNATPSQLSLAQMASNFDWFGSSSAGSPVENPNAPLSGVAGNATASGVLQKAGSLLAFLTSGSGWERIGVIIIGIILLGIAGFMLASKGFEGTVRTVANAA